MTVSRVKKEGEKNVRKKSFEYMSRAMRRRKHDDNFNIVEGRGSRN